MSSSSGAKDAWPTLMGVYRLTGDVFSDLPVYKHETEESYLYMDSDDDWSVSNEVIPLPVSSLYSDRDQNSNLPPTTGWTYDAGFLSDPLMRVKLIGEPLSLNW